MKPIKLNIKTKSEKYPIIIGTNILKDLAVHAKKNSIDFNKCLLVIDKNVPTKMISKITKSLKKKQIFKFIFNSNEKNKNLKNVNKILQILLNKNFSRLDCLLTVGGGITGDVGGFAASLYKRGLNFINIPTTLLSQVDSSVGGKTGVNTIEGKNLLGSFYQPKMVLSETEFLRSLPKREIICGYGEIFKHSLILNKTFYRYLNKYSSNILNLKSPHIEKAIYKSCKIKKEVIEKDEKEKGKRKILNFGHTFAHSFEASLGYSKRLNHGEAVILGITSALKFGYAKKILKFKEYNFIINHLKKYQLPFSIKKYFSIKDLKKILYFMTTDKKNNSNQINLILLKKIGHPLPNYKFSKNILRSFLKKELIN